MKRGALSSLIPSGARAAESSPVFRLRPESRLGLAAGLIVLTAWAPAWAMPVPGLLLLAGFHLAGIPPLDAVRRLRAFFWFLLAVVLFPALFTAGPGVPGPLGGPLPVSAGGLAEGGLSALRMAFMFMTSWLLLCTTSAESLVNLADRAAALSPWRRESLGEFFRIGLIAFQMLPRLCLEADRLLVEGVAKQPAGKGFPWQKARQAAGLVAPLVVAIFKEPERFAAGAEAGEGGQGPVRAEARE